MNKYLETGTIFRKADGLAAPENDVTNAVRKAVADHRRLLQGPHGSMAGKRSVTLRNGTTITTWITPFGLTPTLIAQVTYPQSGKPDEFAVIATGDGWYAANNMLPEYFLYVFRRHDTGIYGPIEVNPDFAESWPGEELYTGPIINPAVSRGTRHSGRMREVVQILSGMTTDIEYKYGWDYTHGIFINQTTGVWWVIEIKASRAGADPGVFAWPLELERRYTDEEMAFLGVTIQGIPASGATDVVGKIQLASSEDLDIVYDDSLPFYTDHGWAFSYDGHKAATITVWGDGQTQETLKQSSIFSMTITPDGNGDPVSAEIVKGETGYCWGILEDSPKFPLEHPGYGPIMLSWDMGWHRGSGYTEPIGNKNAPLDVFFSPGSDEMHVVRYSRLEATSESTSENNMPSGATLCNGGIILDLNAAGTFYDGEWYKFYGDTVLYDFSVGRPETNTDQRYTEWSDVVVHTQSFEELGTMSYNGLENSFDKRVFFKTYSARVRKSSGGSTSWIRHEVFFKPCFDRELIGLHYMEALSVTYGGATEYWVDALGGGGGYGDSGMMTELVDAQPPYPCEHIVSIAPLYAGYGVCGTEYPTVDTGTQLFQVKYSTADVVTFQVPGSLPDQLCNTKGACITGELNSDCHYENVPAVEGQFDAFVKTWLYDNKNGAWVNVYNEEEYKAFDPMFEFLDDPTLQGAYRFLTYLDSFTNRGLTYTAMNTSTVEAMMKWGNPQGRYTILTGEVPTVSSWFGIPFVND